MQLRRGREFYGNKYEEAVLLHGKGMGIRDIAKQLGVSYSTAYHWVKGLRKPEPGNVNEFVKFLGLNGPSAAVHVMRRFPKHNELFLMASRRGVPVKRAYLGKKYKELATWYYLVGQEKQLEERVCAVKQKVEALKARLRAGSGP